MDGDEDESPQKHSHLRCYKCGGEGHIKKDCMNGTDPVFGGPVDVIQWAKTQLREYGIVPTSFIELLTVGNLTKLGAPVDTIDEGDRAAVWQGMTKQYRESVINLRSNQSCMAWARTKILNARIPPNSAIGLRIIVEKLVGSDIDIFDHLEAAYKGCVDILQIPSLPPMQSKDLVYQMISMLQAACELQMTDSNLESDEVEAKSEKKPSQRKVTEKVSLPESLATCDDLRSPIDIGFASAGIIPVCTLPNGEIAFLLGMEDRSHKRGGKQHPFVWNGFGGKREANEEEPLKTAVRELVEESRGIIATDSQLFADAIASCPKVWYEPGKYVWYFIPITHEENLPELFAQQAEIKVKESTQVEIAWIPAKVIFGNHRNIFSFHGQEQVLWPVLADALKTDGLSDLF